MGMVIMRRCGSQVDSVQRASGNCGNYRRTKHTKRSMIVLPLLSSSCPKKSANMLSSSVLTRKKAASWDGARRSRMIWNGAAIADTSPDVRRSQQQVESRCTEDPSYTHPVLLVHEDARKFSSSSSAYIILICPRLPLEHTILCLPLAGAFTTLHVQMTSLLIDAVCSILAQERPVYASKI